MKVYWWSYSEGGGRMSDPGEYYDMIVLADTVDEARQLALAELQPYGATYYNRKRIRMINALSPKVFDSPGIVFYR